MPVINEENWAVLGDNMALRPVADRILIQEDEFQSRYDCVTCKGKGHTEEICKNCMGSKRELISSSVDYIDCRACSVGAGALKKTYGFKLCPTCNGKKGSVIIPDDQQKPPTTGTVIAIGGEVTEFKVGTKVLYNNYTGTQFEMFKVKLRVMRQHDVACEVKGLQPLTELSKVELKDVGIET